MKLGVKTVEEVLAEIAKSNNVKSYKEISPEFWKKTQKKDFNKTIELSIKKGESSKNYEEFEKFKTHLEENVYAGRVYRPTCLKILMNAYFM